MKDEKSKYLIVSADDITKQLYETERVACCNDFYNIYHRAERITANEVFVKNDVPEEFRKIFVKIKPQVLKKSEAEEYTTGYPFDFATIIVKKVDGKRHIRMNNSPIYYDGEIFDDKYVLSSEEHYTSFNNVMYFLEECYRNGCLDGYLQSIKEFFDMSLDWGLLFDSWNQTHSKPKTLKLYKQRVASKRLWN